MQSLTSASASAMALQWTCIKAARSEAEQTQAFQRHWSLKEVHMQLNLLQKYKPFVYRLNCMNTTMHVILKVALTAWSCAFLSTQSLSVCNDMLQEANT